MKKLLLLLLVALFPFPASAQVEGRVVPGYYTTSGCPTSLTPCFFQYGATIPVQTTTEAVATTNSSSTITLGGTFQTIASASTSRNSFEFINICNIAGNCTATSDICYLYVAASGSPSTANSIPLQAGQSYLRSAGTIPSDAIKATCTSTGDAFYLSVQ